MASSDGRVTAEDLHQWFKDAISRRPVPNMDLCAVLAKQINGYKLWDVKRDLMLDFIPEALSEARALSRSLLRIKRQISVHEWPVGDALIGALVAFEKEWGHVPRSVSGNDKWCAYASIFTPDIVETLQKAGWSNPSQTSDNGPVTAVLSKLIGAATGEEPPDQASLGRSLREAKRTELSQETGRLGSRRIRLDEGQESEAAGEGKTEPTVSIGKTRRKSSSTSSDESGPKRR
jgi:hypothetical protein